MSDFPDYMEDAICNWYSKVAFPATLTNVWVALYTALTDAELGTGTEVTGGAYARQVVTWASYVAGTGFLDNTGFLITFPTATAAWGIVTHACLRDAVTAGNPLSTVKALVASKDVQIDDIFRFPAGNLSFTVA